MAYEPHMGQPIHPDGAGIALGDTIDDKIARNFVYNDGHGVSVIGINCPADAATVTAEVRAFQPLFRLVSSPNARLAAGDKFS